MNRREEIFAMRVTVVLLLFYGFDKQNHLSVREY